jgi:hypothetical protein
VFTDWPLPMLAAEATHCAHAIIEQVIADLKNGPLAHLPSGRFRVHSAWLVCAAIAFNLTRAAGALASVFHERATTATMRARLICHRWRTRIRVQPGHVADRGVPVEPFGGRAQNQGERLSGGVLSDSVEGSDDRDTCNPRVRTLRAGHARARYSERGSQLPSQLRESVRPL